MIAGIVGKLGRGKTLLLTALAYVTHEAGSIYTKHLIFDKIFNYSNCKTIYSNYKLNFDFKPVTNAEALDNMTDGSAFFDEFWLWCDSRMSMSQKNKSISGIALKSRKRNMDIYYTAQNLSRIEKRIRNITDVILIPEINEKTGIMTVEVCEPNEKFKLVLRKFKIYILPFLKMYDTKEEIQELETDNRNSETGKVQNKSIQRKKKG